ncbi:MAG: GreA/GreB family elongation factor [Planctomycetes bacterium]|nr:GreA/GreB family elongation factor [Planctomycetota bacterium]
MNIEAMMSMVEAGQMEQLEAAWIQAVDEHLAPASLCEVLTALVTADQLDTAETLGWELLAERAEQLAGEPLLSLAKSVVCCVPASDQLRSQAGHVYRGVFADNPDFDALLEASGLLSGQSPRRAFRTLETCLGIKEDNYLINRFDQRVIRVIGYDKTLGEFETVDALGRTTRIEPKSLADEFDQVDGEDFRVLRQHDPGRVAEAIEHRPVEVLIALCKSVGGQIDANALKGMLVPDHLTKDKWPGWWNRARTAARRSKQLSMTGRPIVVSYHPDGQSLEDELADLVASARTPLEFFGVLRRYIHETRDRKLPIEEDFTGPLLAELARQAGSLAADSPADALAAALALGVAEQWGLGNPAGEFPSADTLLSAVQDPADIVAALTDPALFPAAIDALCRCKDGADHLAGLLRKTPASLLSEVVGRLVAASREEAVVAAIGEAMADPRGHLDICLWLWSGPQYLSAGVPAKAEQLRKLLGILRELEKDIGISRNDRREISHRIRSALSAGNYASYRQAVSEMDHLIASTVKNQIIMTTGLAQAVSDEMLNILREGFYSLFTKEKVAPWADKTAMWTTEAALHRRENDLKHLVDVKMAENAKAIGVAVSHGDLSENSEWRFAIEERDLLRAQAAKIRDELVRARVMHPHDVGTESVGIGSRVRLVRNDDGKELSLDLLGPWDSDVSRHVYNYQSLLAQSMLGKKVGEEVTLKLDGGPAVYRIDSLASAMEEPSASHSGSS